MSSKISDEDLGKLLEVLSNRYLSAFNDLSGCDIQAKSCRKYHLDCFDPPNSVIVLVEFTGSVVGFFSVCLQEETIANLLELGPLPEGNERKKFREQYDDLLKETLNAVAWDCIDLIKRQYPTLTILAPKVIYGHVSFPRIPCQFEEITTDYGSFTFSVYIDSMMLEINLLTERLRKQTQELEEANEREKKLHAELLLSEKLSSIGKLAAGIAHEINTPIQYIGNNLSFFQEESSKLLEYIQLAQGIMKSPDSDASSPLKSFSEDIDLDFLKEEIPNSVRESLEGISHVAKIVQSMKEFSHPGSDEKVLMDINKAIQNAVTVTQNEWKYCSEVKMDLDDRLPEIPCLMGPFNQVLLNLIVNGVDAIKEIQEKNNSEKAGVISIKTFQNDGHLEIHIQDTGVGIPENIRSQIFDPFFTTKDVGQGSGQGLAVTYGIISDLNGTIDVVSEIDQGATFIIKLPIDSP